MVRHFENRSEAKKFKSKVESVSNYANLHIYKKLKGHKNRGKKPFVVCNAIEWLNLD
jgi:hypothetical protein